MKLGNLELKAKTLAIKLAEWSLLFIMGVGSAAVYEASHPAQPDHPQTQTVARTA